MLAAEAPLSSHVAESGQLALAAALTSALNGAPAFAVAVSGGSDSMALLRLAAQLPHAKIFALTVDHGLREGSRSEAEQVARWCAELAIPHHILKWDGVKPTRGIQAKARAARYDLLTRWCRDNNVPVLLTAHTLNDQAETVVMRKQRTASAASLAGIWPETQWGGIRVLRPLLNVSRCTLRVSLRQAGQVWLDDPSNENDLFERVRIRRTLRLSDMSRLGREAAEAQAKTMADRISASRWLRANARVHATGHITFPRAAFSELDGQSPLQVLADVIAASGGGHPERAELLRVAEALAGGGAFRRCLGGALIAARSREVVIGREPGRVAQEALPVPPGGLLWDGRFVIHAPPGSSVSPALGRRHGAAKDLPAFVREALPVLENAAGRLVFPHFDQEPGVQVQLGERFCL